MLHAWKFFDGAYVVIGTSDVQPVAVEPPHVDRLAGLQQIAHQVVESVKARRGQVRQDIAADHVDAHADLVWGGGLFVKALEHPALAGY